MDEKEIERLDTETAEKIAAKCFSGDRETDHMDADDMLVELLNDLGFRKTVEWYQKVSKWYA